MILRQILRAVLEPETPQLRDRDLPRDERTKMPDLTLEKAYTALASDLAVLRADMHEFARESRLAAARADQVYTWLARLRSDIYESLTPEAQRAFRAREENRAVLNPDGSSNGSLPASPPSPPRGPVSPLDL